MLPILMEQLAGRPRRPGAAAHPPGPGPRRQGLLLARDPCTLLRDRGIIAVIPEPSDQIAAPQTARLARRPPAGFDTEDYKGRNVVERALQRPQAMARLATRYDKLALTYRGGVVLRAVTLWLKRLGDTP